MGRRKRRRVDPTDDWQQLELLCVWEEQREYERIRPLVLFGGPVPERSGAGGAPVAQSSGVATLSLLPSRSLISISRAHGRPAHKPCEAWPSRRWGESEGPVTSA